MLAIVVSMLIILAAAVATAGLVLVGLEGRGRDRAPHLADTMARAARHLNGDGRPPRRFLRLFG
jgi:hypothetical protein